MTNKMSNILSDSTPDQKLMPTADSDPKKNNFWSRTLVFLNMKVRGELACPVVKKKHKKKSCKLCICLLYVLYYPPMMFTCIRVLNRLVVKGGLYVWNTSRWDKQAAGWAKTNKLAKAHGAEFCYGYGPQHKNFLKRYMGHARRRIFDHGTRNSSKTLSQPLKEKCKKRYVPITHHPRH
jgi:hypothetical protein